MVDSGPPQAQVLQLEGREAGAGAKKRKEEHLDVGVFEYLGSSILDTRSCSKPSSSETKKTKLSQVMVASLINLEDDHDTGSFQAASSHGAEVTRDEAITADEKAATEAAEKYNEDLISFR